MFFFEFETRFFFGTSPRPALLASLDLWQEDYFSIVTLQRTPLLAAAEAGRLEAGGGEV